MSSEIPTTDENGQEVVDIHDPRDADVLCGRGGAALRHPGNQTYRRLVHLNKGLYITCLKAEKLKISRSIVTAIREQDGRFLERNTKKGTWYDIGDKKAIEKTSQALREGQPKLRQKIVELGGGAAGAAALLENQFPDASSMYQISTNTNSPHQQTLTQEQQQQLINEQTISNMQQRMMGSMPDTTPQQLNQTRNENQNFMHQGFLPQMSDTETAISTILEESANFHESISQINVELPQSGDAAEAGLHQNLSTFSLMSDFSNFRAADSTSPTDIPPPPNYLYSPNSLMSPASFSSGMSAGVPPGDRRKHFARMKYSRPPSGRSNPTGAPGGNNNGSHRQMYSSNKQLYASNKSLDGMPDFYPVESNQSLYSTVSAIENTTMNGTGPDAVASVFESRRSIMSGMSKISDHSDMNSIFSDLSKKIGNVSTRSIAMSELSIMDDRMEDVDPECIPSYYF